MNAPSSIDVCYIDLDADQRNGNDDLHPNEIQLAFRLRDPQKQRRRLAAYRFVRKTLADRLAKDPSSLKIRRDAMGKPYLEGHPLHFNLSHSGHLAALALCKDHPVGIDLELLSPARDLSALVARYFSAAEQRAWEALPERAQIYGFYKCWTRKEAYLKARGLGLRKELRALSMPLDEAPAAGLAVQDDDDQDWFIYPWVPDDGCVAAVAAPRQDSRIRIYRGTRRHPS